MCLPVSLAPSIRVGFAELVHAHSWLLSAVLVAASDRKPADSAMATARGFDALSLSGYDLSSISQFTAAS